MQLNILFYFISALTDFQENKKLYQTIFTSQTMNALMLRLLPFIWIGLLTLLVGKRATALCYV